MKLVSSKSETVTKMANLLVKLKYKIPIFNFSHLNSIININHLRSYLKKIKYYGSDETGSIEIRDSIQNG